MTMDPELRAHMAAHIAAANREAAQWRRQRRRHLLTHPRELWEAVKIDVVIAGYVVAWFVGALVVLCGVQVLWEWMV